MSQTYYTQKFIRQLPGMLIGNGAPPKVRSMRNNRGGTFQVTTFAVTAAGTGAANYSIQFSVPGFPSAQTLVEVTFDAAHSIAELVEAIVVGINTNPVIYQYAAIAELDPDVANGIKITGLKRGEDTLSATPVITPSGAGAGTISAPAQVDVSTNVQIGYGLFVGQYANQLGSKDAALPIPANAAMTVTGVTLITRWNERDRVGPEGTSGYEPFDMMDVIQRTLQNKGIVVRCVEPDITPGQDIYVSTDANTLGYATTVSAGNIALPDAEVIEGSYVASEMGGVSTIQVELK